LTPPRICSDSSFPANWNNVQWCPQPDTLADTCFSVKFPDTQLYLSLEVPVTRNTAYPEKVSCLQSATTEYPIGWPFCIPFGCTTTSQQYFTSETLYDYNFADLKLGVDFSFKGAPTISGIPNELGPEFVSQLETLAMQVMNTQFRQIIDNVLSDKLENLLAPTVDFLNTLTAASISSCFTFKDVETISCKTEEIPVIPPRGCDACDQCCICLTAGDCSQKCQSNCPCVRQFCTEVSRGIAPLWVILFVLGILIVLVATAVAMFGIRGLGPASFRG
jgi:hypothetical protein